MMLEEHVVLVGCTSDAPEDLHACQRESCTDPRSALTSHFMNSLTYDPKPSIIWPVMLLAMSSRGLRGPEAYVVVIPDIQLRDLAIGPSKRLRPVPAPCVRVGDHVGLKGQANHLI